MKRPPSSPPPPQPTGGAAAVLDDGDPFDFVIPPDFLIFSGDEDDWYTDELVMDQQQQLGEPAPAPAQGGEDAEERLSMSYHGQTYVFDSVQPPKVETIISLLNGQEMASQTVKPQLTYLVQPIVVPENFDRSAALMRYRKKKRNLKSIVKADYRGRSEVAFRMKRKNGRFAASPSVHSEGKTTEPTFCTNCKESSHVTPMMRRAPNGSKTFCNACGLMWANTGKLRKPTSSTFGGRSGR